MIPFRASLLAGAMAMAATGIQYVGGQTVVIEDGATPAAVAFSLSGGIASAPAAGDLVLVSQCLAASNVPDVNTGYRRIARRSNLSATYGSTVEVLYKFMGGTPDTTFSPQGSGDPQSGQVAIVTVWRGVKDVAPFDVPCKYADGNSTTPDPAAITPVTTGAVVVVATADLVFATPNNSGGYTHFAAATDNDTYPVAGAVGAKAWTSGAYDPPATDNQAGSTYWSAATVVLRPSTGAAYSTANWLDTLVLVTGGTSDGGTTFTDESLRNRLIQVYGDAQTDTAITLQGSNTILFDGAGDYLSFPESRSYWLKDEDFTIDLFVRLSSLPSGGNTADPVGHWNANSSQKSWRTYFDSAGKCYFRWSTDGAANTGTIGGATTFSVGGAGYHLRACRSGSTMRLFKNGVLEASGAISGSLHNPQTPMAMAASQVDYIPASLFNGSIAEFRIIRGALNTSDASFTPPSTPWGRG